jgi:PAS domain S-box-containing protein
VWFDATITPLSGTSVIWVARDITGRRQAVRAIEEIDERLRRALESIPDVVVIYDPDLRIQYINPATRRVTGRPASDFIGRRDADIWPPEICQAYVPLLEEARRKRITRAADVQLSLPATGTRHLRITCIPLLDEAGEVRELLGITHDYTEQWQADRARREGEQRLRAIIDGARSLVWMKDLDGRFLVVNEYTCSVLGLTSDQIIGRTVEDLFPSSEAQAYRGNDHLVVTTGQTMEFEETAQLADGAHVFLSVKIPLRDEQGRIYALAALCTDITWRKRAEQALQESEARFRSYVEGAPVAVFVADRQGRYVDSNPAAEALLGFDQEALRGKSIADVVAPEDAEAVQQHFERVVTEGRCVGDFRLVRADGAVIWVTVQAVRVSPDRFMAYCVDITARRQAESTLRQQGAALEAAANAIVITDREGVIRWVNPAFSLLTGYTAEEARGRKPGQLIRSGQQDDDFYRAMWETILAGRVWRGEIVNRRKDGSLFTEDMTITPLRDEVGAITHFVAIKQDITHRKQMEAQLLRTQRLESVGRLASGIAHDLNNILTPVLLAPPILREALQDKAALNIVDSIEASAERGAAIIRQLLTFGRGTATHRVPLPIRTLMRDMMKIMEETFPKNIRLRLEVPPDLALVTGDATQLHQVLMNLCVNARDAMPQGGQLTLSLQPALVDEVLARMHPGAHPGRHVMVSVADTGTGIPPEHLDKIFDPFFTTKAVGEGTGLGLSTVAAIVRGHEGILLVDSVPGQGTTFRIFLPITEVPAEPARSNHDTARPPGQGELVLVVDDETQIRAVTRRVLEHNGYHTIEAENGAEALALFDEQHGRVKVVLTDLMMPVLDGAALMRALRERDPQLPIIAVSGYLSQPELLAAVEADAQVFLAKPCSSADLLQALQKVLRRT